MSTVSFSSSETLSSSEHDWDEESSCSDGGDFADHECLSNKSSQGSIYIDSESEDITSEDREYAVEKIAASFTFMAENQAQQRIHRPAQQHANLIWEDPTISETPWTDEKHSLYLNSIEEAFIKRLYERGHFRYSCKRWAAERITTSVSSKGLYEPSNLFPEEKSTKAQMRCNYEEIQNRTKRSRLDRICIKQGQREEFIKLDLSGRVNNCKYLKEPAGKGSEETEHVPNKYSPKIQMKYCEHTYKHDQGRNTEISERYMQKDQVVPSMENTSRSS